MKAAVYYPDKKTIQIDERPVPTPDNNHLLVQVGAAGICGSDMHYYKDGHIGEWWIRQPHVLGHEFAGTIASVGSNVTGFSVGDRVAIEPILPCETCHACQQGFYNLCLNLKFTGSPHTDGAFQEYVLTRPRFTHHLPAEMLMQLAALVEPTSIAVHAVRRSGLTLGDTVAVIGAGPIGLLTVAAARASGAKQIFVTDIDQTRLEKARDMGATHILPAEDNPLERLTTQTKGRGVDITFEAVGLPQTIDLALNMTRPAGRLTVIGVSPQETIPFNLMLAQAKEIDVSPIYLGRDAFPTAIALLASGRINAKAIVTHTFAITDAAQAMDTAAYKKDNAIKVMMTFEQ